MDLETSNFNLLPNMLAGAFKKSWLGNNKIAYSFLTRHRFEAEIRRHPEVVECLLITGQSADYLLKAVVPDMEYYEKFLLGKLTRIDGVSGVHSSFELRRVIHRSGRQDWFQCP